MLAVPRNRGGGVMSLPQHMVALSIADDARLAHAATKRHVKSLSKDEALALAAAIIRHPVDHELSLRVDGLLRALPSYGPERTRMMLRYAGIVGGGRTIRDLTPAQRDRIADALPLPLADLRRRGPVDPVVDGKRVQSAAARLRELVPGVQDPALVARVVLEHDESRWAA